METLRQLGHVVALSEHGNYHVAARNLGITQSALSQSIQKLEELYGVPLFTRGGGGVRPTKYGVIVIESARATLARLAEVRHELRIVQRLGVSRIAIGCDPFLSEAFVMPALADNRVMSSGCSYSLVTGSWDEMQSRLIGRQLHVHLGFVDASPDPRVLTENYSVPPWQIYFRRDHPLAGRDIIGIDDVFAFPIIAPKLPLSMISWLRKYYLRTHPKQYPRIPAYLLTSDQAIIRHLILRTNAIGPAFPWTIREDLERELIWAANVPEFPHVPCVIARLAHARPLLGLDIFLAALRDQMARTHQAVPIP